MQQRTTRLSLVRDTWIAFEEINTHAEVQDSLSSTEILKVLLH